MTRNSDDYDRKKQRAGEREASISRSGRDIGPPPKVKNKRRRSAAIKSFAKFLEYFPETIYLELSPDHKAAIKRIESAARKGGRFAFAMPRGSGKTTLTELAALWAILTGRRKFIAIVGSDKPSAISILDSIKTELETNDLLCEDFPEACHAIRALEGEARRCVGQHIEGVRTRIGWSSEEIVFPLVAGSLCSESVIRVAGITGRIRGMKYKTSDGKTLRPDLAIVDDPQTEESAYSDPQCASRERAIKRAVCRLAGPGKDIAVFMPCTILRKDDLADRFLNKKLNPDWNGMKTKMLYSFPSNMELWDQYDDIRRRELEEGGDPAESREFYIANHAAMNKGAKVGWEARKSPTDVDALQHAMDLWFEDPAGFMAEYNNDPQEDLVEGQVEIQTADAIMQRTNGFARGAVPSWATKLTAFIDVQQDCLFWIVAAWSDDFRGAVIDYGCFPDQGRTYFTKADLRKTLRQSLGVKSHQAAIRKGLEQLVGELMGRAFPVEAGGGRLPIERLGIDASYEPLLIYSFCRQYGDSRVTPYHGKYVGASSIPMSQYKAAAGEKIGFHWLRPSVRGKKLGLRHYVADVNFWKTFIHSRFSIEVGAKGDLTLFGKDRDQRYHRMFADHQTAQFCVRVEANGRAVDEWKRRGGKDHDWFDGLVGAAALACVEGCALPEWSRRKVKKNLARRVAEKLRSLFRWFREER